MYTLAGNEPVYYTSYMRDTTIHTVSLFDAKTHLSKLIEDVQSGKTITITKRGNPIAQLVPYRPKNDRQTINDILRQLQNIRDNVKGKVGIRQYISEGRKN
jgi:prevent-host-death family protein